MQPGVEAAVRVDASVARVRDVIEDVDAWPDWARGVRESSVLARDDSGRPVQARFVVDTPVGPVGYTLAYAHTENEVRWRLVAGELIERLDGAYSIRPDGDGSLVEGTLEIGVSLPVPGSMVRRMADEILTRGLDDLRARCERDE
jgi:ribosome-associated toxin RatA of RatAB toxin-antitoxin module